MTLILADALSELFVCIINIPLVSGILSLFKLQTNVNCLLM